MDLKAEILSVLDNPARVWDAVLTNLANEPRISLLVLTTCRTPISLVKWQEALALVSTGAAVTFGSSLRVLDDSFITITRISNIHHAEFRNPSMDDFCAGYLNRNVGIATTVASHGPALHQIVRLIQLGTTEILDHSGDTFIYRKKYPSIYDALISDPSVLLLRLLEIMPDDTRMSDGTSTSVLQALRLLSQAKSIPDKVRSTVRARLLPTVLGLEWEAGSDIFLFSVFDNYSLTKALADLLDSDFEVLYEQLSRTARSMYHFDTLTTVDDILMRDGANASWSSRFEELTPGWLEESDSSENLESSRDMWSRIAEHLELDEYMQVQEWNNMIEAAKQEEADEVKDDDNSPLQKSQLIEPDDSKDGSSEEQQIDAMFSTLTDPLR